MARLVVMREGVPGGAGAVGAAEGVDADARTPKAVLLTLVHVTAVPFALQHEAVAAGARVRAGRVRALLAGNTEHSSLHFATVCH